MGTHGRLVAVQLQANVANHLYGLAVVLFPNTHYCLSRGEDVTHHILVLSSYSGLKGM